jgi:cell division protein FtsI (penicillin-binding protein 3)
MPERGTIVDRNGAALALSVTAPSVYATPEALTDRKAAAAALARALGLERRHVEARLDAHPSFVFVARWVDPTAAERVRDLGLPGVGVLEEPRRVYPHRGLAGPMLGFANIDGEGVRGVEQKEDAWLRGTARRIPVERDARGRLLAEGGIWSTAGGDVALTIDATLQAEAAEQLRHSVEATGARSGVVISMDPYTGDILTLSEDPSFDPNGFRELRYGSTRSRSFLDAAEPGSTMKLFLVAAALERGAVRPSDRFDCENGEFEVPGKIIHDSHPHGELSIEEILRFSSNIGAVKIGQALGPRPYFEMLQSFGFGTPSGSLFPDESAGMLRSWKEWRPVDHATISFGQGISVTPIQLAAATAVLANGGHQVRPRLVAARRAAGGAWRPTEVQRGERVVHEETARAVLGMLESVVTAEGTGRRAALEGVRVAGKTGTAQKFDAARGRYADDRFTAWFVGVTPAEDPRVVIVVGLDEPRRPLHTGGGSAAPLFARVATSQLARFGIATAPRHIPRPTPSADPEDVPLQIAKRVADPSPAPAAKASRPAAKPAPAPAAEPRARPEPPPTPVVEVARLNERMLVPDLRGLTEAEVRQVTANTPIALQIQGSGRVVSQVPPPGTIVAARDALVLLRFEHRRNGNGEG